MFLEPQHLYRAACRLSTLTVFVCLVASSLGALPILSSIVAPGSQPGQEELETHPDVRIDSPRRLRLRSFPDTAVALVPSGCAMHGCYCGRRLPPHLLVSPFFIGAGIRLRC